ncbi:hypothetical protein ACFPPD_12320 [Cohnella suwonensis]|uniref:Bacterial transcription activator effector binding domain-containing protein n=1 Tax=Cohnella suwonensis TaxID=696072 RepID=A0ABW0LUH7_9BACL
MHLFILAVTNLYLPVQRKLRNEPIEVVHLTAAYAFYCREYGPEAQRTAEQRLIDGYEKKSDGNRLADKGNYYMSYPYGADDSEEYWWENGILAAEPEAEAWAGMARKNLESGLYACCVSKTYGLLTGVLDRMHRWISSNARYRFDEERQWYAEYHTFEGMNIERDAIVKVYIPILSEETDGHAKLKS